MTAVSKNVYFHVLDDIVDKYNNTFHKIIKMKPIDVKSDSYAEYVDSNEKGPKFKVGDHVRISKYKNIFAKVYTLIGQKKSLLLAKLKMLFHGLVISDLNGEEIIGTFYEKELQKTDQKNLE